MSSTLRSAIAAEDNPLVRQMLEDLLLALEKWESSRGTKLSETAEPSSENNDDLMPVLRIRTEVGCLSRGWFVNEIRGFCDWHGIACDIKEYRGWLSSGYLIRLQGPRHLLETVVSWVRSLD